MLFNQKGFLFFIAYFCLISVVFSQNQRVADSLIRIYNQNVGNDSTRLELLRLLSFNEVKDLNLALKYAEELINLSETTNNKLYLHRGYFQKGNKKRLFGDLEEALDAYFKSAEAAREADYAKGVGNAFGAIADIYSISNNHENARHYYRKAIEMLRESNDSIALASAILNAGHEFNNSRIYDTAFVYLQEAEVIFEKLNYPAGKAYSKGNIGMVYFNTDEDQLAEENLKEAIRILEELEDYSPICSYLIYLADISAEKGDERNALNFSVKSLTIAEQYGLKEQIRDASYKLSELYERSGNLEESYKHFKNYITYRDSINSVKTVQNMANLRTDFELSQKQAEVDLLNQEKHNQRIMVIFLFIILGLTTIILATLFWYYRTISREKRRSESLLLNILPSETAKELLLNGRVEAVKFDEVTVLFTDFVEFSKSAEHMEPEQLVKSIDLYFRGFDKITTKHGLEKIKTIGDSYMCACGLPTATKTHARNVIYAAMEMIEMVNDLKNSTDGLTHYDVRIGVHSGPVVAGIVGIKKWQYDIWGDTVNIASRMESNSNPGRINLSETTYQLIKDEFSCEYRGEIEVKNRGILKMYYLT
jgi:class 3 adenylate cyclase/Tfp pilus assembly protein PilF